MTAGSDEPTAPAQAIMERVLRLVTECRSVLRALERPGDPGESSSAEAERILYSIQLPQGVPMPRGGRRCGFVREPLPDRTVQGDLATSSPVTASTNA